MKRFIYTLMLMLASSTASVQAQRFAEEIHYEASIGTGIKHRGITPIDFSFNLHTDLLSFLYISIVVEDNISLYKNKEEKTYSNGASLGGGLGVKLLHHSESQCALDLRIKSLSSLGKPDWKRTTYAASLA